VKPQQLAVIAGALALGMGAGAARADEAQSQTQFRIDPNGPRPMMVIANVDDADAAARGDEAAAAGPAISNVIYINRCVGGCQFTQSASQISDAINNRTWLGGDFDAGTPGSGAPGTVYNLPEFPYSDASFDAIVECVREIYAPYNVTVTDVDPGSAGHHEAVIAGGPGDLGLNEQVGGVGPLYASAGGSCEPHDLTVSFTFVNIWPDNPQFLCSVIAQESAHGFGLEHSFNCADPLTYLVACGLQYFRNQNMPCGEFSERPCTCSAGATRQNTHQQMIDVFGPSDTVLPSPVITFANPSEGQTVADEFTIALSGSNRRGIGRFQVLFNDYLWIDEPITDVLDTSFITTAPADLPDGVIDVEVRLYNDIETTFGSETVTVTKGAACTSADTCLAGQQCEDGRCFWAPPSGALGEACEYDQFCLSALCVDGQCSQDCNPTVTGSCPGGLTCVNDGGGAGHCVDDDGGDGGGGCCSTSEDTGAAGMLVQLGLAGLVLGGALRRRRARA
jgi:MYXO-CTERM domain-containing protein